MDGDGRGRKRRAARGQAQGQKQTALFALIYATKSELLRPRNIIHCAYIFMGERLPDSSPTVSFPAGVL